MSSVPEPGFPRRRRGRVQTLVGTALVAAMLATHPATSAAPQEFEPVTVPMEPRQVATNSWYVVGQAGMVSTQNEGFNSNAAFVVTRDGVVLFDALGSPALGKRLAGIIDKVSGGKPVRHVVVSHYHADHVYGLQAFAGPGVTIHAHQLVADYLASAAPQDRLAERRESLAPWVNQLTRIVPPTHLVGKEHAFEFGGMTFRLLHAGPAHSPEDLMMMVEPEGVLFVGDLMFTGRIPFVGDADVSAWIDALDRVLLLKPRVVVGGHGPVSMNAIADLSLTRDYLAYLREHITLAFEEGLDFEEAYARIDWSRFSSLPAFEAANRRNAYQAYLGVERDALSGMKR